MDYVFTNAKRSDVEVMLHMFEDSEAITEMIRPKSNDETRVPKAQSRACIGCLTESMLDPFSAKSKPTMS